MKSQHIVLLAVTIFPFFVACQSETIVAPSNANSEGIHVSGTGQISASPDIAYAQLGIQTFSVQLDEALTANNKLMASINNALQNAGVSNTDIVTTQFNVNPQYDYEKDSRELLGYWVNNQIRVTCRELTKIGNLLQIAVDAGANTVNGIQFSIEDTEALRAQARSLAVADARQRAETLATAAGVKLGQAIDIRESSNDYPLYARAEFDLAQGAVPIESGQLDVTISVQVLFAINP
ncbi:MAG: SIMPL domain-containing protein [Candidatus Latescibacterota bacterium]|nr:SIMPL domain-containing protein [Candidatus Latescibacterota bacterium]